MQANYRYVVEQLAPLTDSGNAVVLDYGCGKGDIVTAGRELGFQMYGVERFYGGSDIRAIVAERGLLGGAIRELEQRGRIPFDDETFDLVVSNQVFEHIPDLRPAIEEIARVLKPGGRLLCLFPTIGVLREVHCGVPIVHWLPKSTRARYYWLLIWRAMGFGYHKAGKTRRQWAADFHQWLNDFTHYRSRRRIRTMLGAHFDDLQPLEHDYLMFRLRRKNLVGIARAAGLRLVQPLARLCVRAYGGLVMSARKR